MWMSILYFKKNIFSMQQTLNIKNTLLSTYLYSVKLACVNLNTGVHTF